MGSHPQPISATIMASWLKTIPLLLFVLPFTFASRELHNACGLKMQVLSSSSSMTTMLRCEDTLSRRNPRWNITDVSGRTLGQLRLQGVGFSAVSIPWRNVTEVNVECRTSTSCALAASLTRRGELESQEELTRPTISQTTSKTTI